MHPGPLEGERLRLIMKELCMRWIELSILYDLGPAHASMHADVAFLAAPMLSESGWFVRLLLCCRMDWGWFVRLDHCCVTEWTGAGL